MQASSLDRPVRSLAFSALRRHGTNAASKSAATALIQGSDLDDAHVAEMRKALQAELDACQSLDTAALLTTALNNIQS